MSSETVVMKVPATAEHVALLRTVVHFYAGRTRFTLDQIEDLKMAVDEAGVQLLKLAPDEHIVLELEPLAEGLEMRLGARARAVGSVIEEDSFSWQILRALTDSARTASEGGIELVILRKHYLADGDPTS